MAKIYKIHPGIGIARIGDSPDGFFIGPEIPGVNPVEIIGGNETPVEKYKDSSGRIKRQAARFRVFEYEEDADGTLTPLREITLGDAQIEWQVTLANGKAAAERFGSAGPRNPGVPIPDLEIKPVFEPISGANQTVTASSPGFFKGKEVYLGELRTDAQGRLMVLGGRGLSASEPAGRPITGFANNEFWHDDVADGPIEAQVTFPNGDSFTVEGAWVLVAPPDFAPQIYGLTTLYDIAFQAAVNRGWLFPPTTPSFRDDILPIIQRGANLRWVDQWGDFLPIAQDPAILGSKTDPGADSLRSDVFSLLVAVEDFEILNDFQFTEVQRDILDKWLSLDFIEDFHDSPPTLSVTPSNLDRAALEQAVGGGFFPGIEAGILMTNSDIYSEAFRLTRSQFSDNGVSLQLEAGSITARMAVPWQADFLKCSRGWWPAQRPNRVMVNTNDVRPNENWIPGGTRHTDLVENFGRLGFIVPRENRAGETVFVEDERDPTFPH
ncbi:MAG: LodA/GoxA family CTQ-dependent oxidase [Calothrix sp. MO_167.B12]|nr:LodA/GoxA family CTQ-dependent oxidase [Calothrix sp. MO_167.B12]